MPETHTLLDGLVMGEVPRWHDDRLWFSGLGARTGHVLTAEAPAHGAG